MFVGHSIRAMALSSVFSYNIRFINNTWILDHHHIFTITHYHRVWKIWQLLLTLLFLLFAKIFVRCDGSTCPYLQNQFRFSYFVLENHKLNFVFSSPFTCIINFDSHILFQKIIILTNFVFFIVYFFLFFGIFVFLVLSFSPNLMRKFWSAVKPRLNIQHLIPDLLIPII